LRTFESAHSDTAVSTQGVDGQPILVQPDGSHAGKLLLAVGATLSIVILAMLVIWQVFDYSFQKERIAKDLGNTSTVLTQLRATQGKVLSSYQRIDSKATAGLTGRYRIPIERAMDLLTSQPNRIGRPKRIIAVESAPPPAGTTVGSGNAPGSSAAGSKAATAKASKESGVEASQNAGGN